ncbi:MAG: MoaD/ThiS family protein [Dehalococcoidia bacterium]
MLRQDIASAISIRLPSALRRYSDGSGQICLTAATVEEALDQLLQLHPGLAGMICDERGQLRRHVNIFRGHDEIRTLQGLATLLLPGMTLTVLPAVSGG